MNSKTLLRSVMLFVLMVVAAIAADVSGTWKATFDTQIGQQNYTYELKVDGDKLTGKATSDNGTSELTEGSVKGDDISFVEMLNYQGMPIRIEYKGKIAGDEIKFTRKVADFASEDLVAKRVK